MPQIPSDKSQGETNPETLENIVVTPAPTVTEKQLDLNKSQYYYAYKKELDFHIGGVLGIEDSSEDEDEINMIFGFSYLLPKKTSPKYVAGADLSTVGHGHFYFARRSIYNETSSFRPYLDYGLMHKFVPDEKGASFSNWENYLLRVGAGFGDLRTPPKSAKFDVNFAIGTEDVLLLLTYGYAWGF